MTHYIDLIMQYKIIIIFILFLILYYVYFFIRLNKIDKNIKKQEKEIIDLFFYKVNKIPAFIEIIKKYTNYPDIFEEIIHLHKLGIIYNIRSVYDLLSLNSRIHREFNFLMKLSAKIPDLHKNGNFLYIKDFISFYEKDIDKGINEIDYKIKKYNNFIKFKNYLLIGLIMPVGDKVEIS